MKYISIISLFLTFMTISCHDAGRHEATLQWADSLNRNYIPITSDSQLIEAAEFYDRHGTSNERMRAHYLLGVNHRDRLLIPLTINDIAIAFLV